MAIVYKEFYNKDRGLPEPKWGSRLDSLQCPTCGSQDMYASASVDDPEEIFPNETVRCKYCGHITDWYEALKQRRNHPKDIVMEVVRPENGIRAFHAHLDVCSQCRNHPFGLCTTGAKLLEKAACG